MRIIVYQIVAAVWLAGVLSGPAAAEEFRYYVWTDNQGIVHADEKAPKGRNYKIRVIQDINANVVPAKDFRIGELPDDFRRTADNVRDEVVPEAQGAQSGRTDEPAAAGAPASGH